MVIFGKNSLSNRLFSKNSFPKSIDVLYVPRGCFHAISTVSDKGVPLKTSMHMTVSNERNETFLDQLAVLLDVVTIYLFHFNNYH